MPEDATFISSNRINPADIHRANFAVVRRGFDPREVRSYLDHLSHELEANEQREADLRRQIAEAEERAANPVISESMLTSALGQQSAAVIRTAHEEAEKILQAAQAQGLELVQTAQHRASQISVEAEQHVAERVAKAEQDATTLGQQAIDHATALVDRAKADGETLVARAREQVRQVVEEAQITRDQVLSDMNVRRRAMFLQLEQLRAARDEITRVLGTTREQMDRLTEQVVDSDEAARLAAQEVVRRQPTPPEFEEASPTTVAVSPDIDVVAEHSEVVIETNELGDIELPDASAINDLFAKIRESARDTGLVPVVSAEGPAVAMSAPDAEAVRGRDELIDAPASALARKIKRILQDEQNSILEGLRDQAVEPQFLGAMELQQQIAGAAVDPLRDASEAGRDYAQRHGGGNQAGLSEQDVVSIAEELGASMLRTMEPRISEAMHSSDPAAAISTAFREWRGPRIDRIVTDAALRAFSAAVLHVTRGGKIRWVAASAEHPCADCSDNALEGSVPSGQQFPTGHQHPPVHAGCRCLIVPTLS